MLMPALAAQTCDWNAVGVHRLAGGDRDDRGAGLAQEFVARAQDVKVPIRSMSTTVLKALADMPIAGARKLPAAPEITDVDLAPGVVDGASARSSTAA
jgi:hypothetical protein